MKVGTRFRVVGNWESGSPITGEFEVVDKEKRNNNLYHTVKRLKNGNEYRLTPRKTLLRKGKVIGNIKQLEEVA